MRSWTRFISSCAVLCPPHDLMYFVSRTSVAVSGLGGNGKTALCGGYIYFWFDRKYKNGIFWVTCDSETHVFEGFLTIAVDQLRISSLVSDYNAGRQVEVRKLQRAVFGWMEAHDDWATCS